MIICLYKFELTNIIILIANPPEFVFQNTISELDGDNNQQERLTFNNLVENIDYSMMTPGRDKSEAFEKSSFNKYINLVQR